MTDPSSMPMPSDDPGDRGRLAQLLAAAVDAVDGARRSGGTGVEVATQYRWGRTLGVRLTPHEVRVCIVAESPQVRKIVDLVHDSVRQALETAGETRRVTVVVDDLDVDPTRERVQ